jgi:hypothetical protein
MTSIMSDNNYDFELTNTEQAILLLVKEGMKEIPKDIFTPEMKDRLCFLKLIQLDSNPEIGWSTTPAGEYAIRTKIAIKYPLHVRGKIGDYDKVIKTMTDSAREALLCAQINNHFFDDIPVASYRVLMQDMLNKGLFKKLGKELGTKWSHELANEYKNKA